MHLIPGRVNASPIVVSADRLETASNQRTGELWIIVDSNDGLGKVGGAICYQEVSAMFSSQTLRSDRGTNDGNTLAPCFENLHPNTTRSE